MADLVSRQELRLRVRRLVDMVDDDFVTEDELDYFIQASFKKLYNRLVAKYESYFCAFATEQDIYSYTIDSSVTSPIPQFGLLAGQKDYFFPERFWKLRRLAIGRGTADFVSYAFEINGSVVLSSSRGGFDDLTKADWEDEFKINSNERQQKPLFYILHGRNDMSFTAGATDTPARSEAFRLIPTPDRAYPLDIVYVPTAPEVEDSLNFFNGWDEYVVLDSCIKCIRKEEGDFSGYLEERKEFLETVESCFLHKDVGQALQIQPASPFLNEDWQEMDW